MPAPYVCLLLSLFEGLCVSSTSPHGKSLETALRAEGGHKLFSAET